MMKFKIRCSQIGKIMGNAKKEGELSASCITYLKEWYAEQVYNDREEIYSKYMEKGNLMEADSIDFIAERLDLGILTKNEISFENDFLTGTPDIICDDFVIDAKSSWCGRTFLEAVTSEPKEDYFWQLQGYMALTGNNRSYLCHTLQNTPEHLNHGVEVDYSSLPRELRFHAKEILLDPEKIKAIESKVQKCNEWIQEYNALVTKLLYA